MTLLNRNHFLIITQAELCLKRTFVKASFLFVTILLDIYERLHLFEPPKRSENKKFMLFSPFF